MKYIIKNCPAYSKDALDFCFAKNATQAICYNCTDCLLKRIVELCDSNASKVLYDGENIKLIKGNDLAVEILTLLEIEEAE